MWENKIESVFFPLYRFILFLFLSAEKKQQQRNCFFLVMCFILLETVIALFYNKILSLKMLLGICFFITLSSWVFLFLFAFYFVNKFVFCIAACQHKSTTIKILPLFLKLINAYLYIYSFLEGTFFKCYKLWSLTSRIGKHGKARYGRIGSKLFKKTRLKLNRTKIL